MKTLSYAEDTDNYSVDNKKQFSIDYVTEAETEEIETVLRRVAEATLQSGLRFMKTLKDDEKGREQVFLDAEDCSASVITNLVSDLEEEEFNLDFRATRQSMDHIVVIFQSDDLVKETEEEEEVEAGA